MAEDAPLDEELIAESPANEEARPDDRIDDERHDEDNILKPEFVRRVTDALDEGDKQAVYELVEPLHEADIADLIELLERDERRQLVTAITDLMSSDVIAHLNDFVREDMLEALPASAVAEIAGELETDDAVQLIEDMDEADQRAVLAELEPEDRAAIESALSYPEETAGRLMNREFVAVPEHLTVGDLIDFLRTGEDLPSEFYEIFVVDEKHHPVGTCQLSWILTTPRQVALADVMKRDQTLIAANLDQEEVGNMFQKYGLISAAVVDASGRLVGQLTVDDVVHIIAEEAGEDVLRLSGAGEGDINEPIQRTIRGRMGWLFINLWTAIAAAAVIAAFEGTIQRIAALAAIMTIVSGMGGNAGTQTMAVVVRALATNQLTSSNTWRMITRELTIALANGFGLGLFMAIGCMAVYHDPKLAAVLWGAMVVESVTAGLAGVLIPVTMDRFGIDPAHTSTVFVTTMTDVVGFFSFLGLATIFLM